MLGEKYKNRPVPLPLRTTMSFACHYCQRDFATGQGRSGHERFVHSVGPQSEKMKLIARSVAAFRAGRMDRVVTVPSHSSRAPVEVPPKTPVHGPGSALPRSRIIWEELPP